MTIQVESKTAHFRLPSAAHKRRVLELPDMVSNTGSVSIEVTQLLCNFHFFSCPSLVAV